MGSMRGRDGDRCEAACHSLITDLPVREARHVAAFDNLGELVRVDPAVRPVRGAVEVKPKWPPWQLWHVLISGRSKSKLLSEDSAA